MNNIFITLVPEIFLSFCILLLLVVDLDWEVFKNKGLNNIKFLNEHICYFIFSFFILSMTLCFLIIFNGDIIFSNKLMINSKIANFLKQFLILISILILGFVSECVKKQKLDVKGYYILYLFIILSSLLILSVNDFLSAFLLIEMQGLLFSVLIAFRKNSPISIEAGIKYFIFSAVNSAVLLFFFSLIYKYLFTLNFNTLSLMTAFPFTGNYQTTGDAVTVCVLIIFATIFFKIGIAPFHFWMPDIYEAAPISTTLILSIYPKIVLFDLSIKLAKCFGVCFDQISFFVYLCGFCSILIGSIFALNQGRLKRLLIYSSIAQTGFPICLLAIDKSTESIAIIYLFIILYVLSAILSWGSFIFLYSSLNIENLTSKKIVQFKEPLSITDLSGFFSVNKVWMSVFIFLFFGLAGIPPSSTFLSKFFIVKMLLNNKFFFLTIFILFVTVISTFYYLYIITLLFFEVVDEKKKNKTIIFIKKEKDIIFFYNCVSIIVCICILFYTVFYLDTWIFYLQKLII